MKKLFLASLLSVTSLFGCNNVVEQTGGAGGNGGGGSGGNTTTTTLPSECAVSTDESAPYSVTFKFVNSTQTSVYLREDCSVSYTVTSCGDGYTEGLVLSGQCTIDCSEQNQCIQCGACLEQGILVDGGTPHESEWTGSTYTFGENNVGCQCHTEHVAPAGKYRITVPVYSSEDAALQNQKSGEVSVDFELPAPNGVVEVQVSL